MFISFQSLASVTHGHGKHHAGHRPELGKGPTQDEAEQPALRPGLASQGSDLSEVLGTCRVASSLAAGCPCIQSAMSEFRQLPHLQLKHLSRSWSFVIVDLQDDQLLVLATHWKLLDQIPRLWRSRARPGVAPPVQFQCSRSPSLISQQRLSRLWRSFLVALLVSSWASQSLEIPYHQLKQTKVMIMLLIGGWTIQFEKNNISPNWILSPSFGVHIL